MAFLIIGLILLLFVLIGFIKVTAEFSLNESLSFKVLILKRTVFKIPISKKYEVDSSGTVREKTKNKPNYFSKLKQEKGFFIAFKTVLMLIEATLKKTVKLLKKICIDKLKIHIIVASEDSAKTALIYSGVCSAVFPLLAFIESNTKRLKKDVLVNTDFDTSAICVDLFVKLSLRVYQLLFLAVALLTEYVKITSKKDG